MVKRTIEIGGDPAEGPVRLNVENDQLVITRAPRDPDRGWREAARIPIEDIGFLLLDRKPTIFSHSVLSRILHHGGAVIVCDEAHLPAGLLLPMCANDLTARRLRAQAAMPLPRRKRLWKQIVRHKIVGQALNLPADHPVRRRLLVMARQVKSGDRGNLEAQAARFYWPALMGDAFRRDPEGLPPNNLLNYGYMVLRAACARAIVAGGLHPVFSLQHSHRNNAFALADDLVEIFRPRVDRVVRGLIDRGADILSRDAKRPLLELLAEPIIIAGQAGPLMVQLGRIVASLVECTQSPRASLNLPEQTVRGLQVLPARFRRRRASGIEPDSQPD